MLIALTALIVCVVALQELDVVTNQGAALATFGVLTLLTMPALVAVVAPIALFLTLLMTLNRLSAESEIIVMNASGGSPITLFRPVLAVALLVSLTVGFIGHFVAPPAQMAWRVLVSEARADLLSAVVREGAFVELQDGLTFHMRAREPGGILTDILIADTSAYPEEIIYFAERGTIVRNDEGSFLAVEDGIIQRRTLSGSGRLSNAYLYFDTYAIDLSFSDVGGRSGFFKPSERSTAYLLNPDPEDAFYIRQPGRFAAELHNRMALPLYPLAHAMIVILALGVPHSVRGGRAKRVVGAIIAAAALQGAQFGASSLISSALWAWPVIYLVPVSVFVGGFFLLRGQVNVGGRTDRPNWWTFVPFSPNVPLWMSRRSVEATSQVRASS
ncbi:MAG: LptF/LptG family permease [Devosiaceae bacterium]|nr:LptF/LptG family permease [Devosiaceae bacterium MH13]